MKNSLCLIFCVVLVLCATQGRAQSTPNTLDIVGWNIEWFGASFENPPDDNLQEQNVKKILRYLGADLYGLTEVVDTMRLRRVVDSLGPDFRYVISPYGSNNITGTGASWLNAQKLAFVYNRTIFSNVTARGLLRGSTGNAYYNFASGRFPFMMSADVTINGVTRSMNFILIHGKAGSTVTDYIRRRDGAAELKDTLDAFYGSSINILLGDFNDALDTTICSACSTTASSYSPIIQDSVDGDHYKSITLPLAYAGLSSMTNYPNVIDNHVISDEAVPMYVPGSASIRSDVAGQVIFYDATTSDHYPVFSQYVLSGVTGVQQVSMSDAGITVFPNPFSTRTHILSSNVLHGVTITLYDAAGRLVERRYVSYLPAGQVLPCGRHDLAPGIYFLDVSTVRHRSVTRIVKSN